MASETWEARFDRKVAELEPLWQAAYDAGVPRHDPLPDVTMADCIAATVADRPDAVHVAYRDEALTYRQTNEAACRVAAALAAAGVARGDRVVVMLGNVPELIEAYMACYKAGYVVVGVNPRSTVDEMAANLADCAPAAVVAPAGRLDDLAAAAERAGAAPRIVLAVADDAPEAAEAPAIPAALPTEPPVPVASFARVAADGPAPEPADPPAPDDPAMIIYTGGTTGVSKGCPLTNRMLLQAQRLFFRDLEPLLGEGRAMTSLVTSPMTHAYGMNFGVNWGFVAGGPVVLAEHLDGPSLAALVERHRPTVWGAVPTLLNDFCSAEERESRDVSSLRAVVVSCAATSGEIMRRFERLHPDVAVVEDYGMTETAGPVTLTPVLRGASAGSVGVPCIDTDVLVVDLETGERPLGFGEHGEVIFRGPQVIKEYWHVPEETAKAFRGDWIYSGDVGYFDEAGCLFVVDRIKDVICVGGFSVFPREIDEVLFAHPAVAEACTVGVPDERSVERPKSFVVLHPGAQLTEQEAIAYCHEHLLAYKCPKYVEFIDRIPTTHLGKPDKRALRAREAARRRP